MEVALLGLENRRRAGVRGSQQFRRHYGTLAQANLSVTDCAPQLNRYKLPLS